MKKYDFNDNWSYIGEDGTSTIVHLPHDGMQTAKRDADAPAGSASGFYYGCKCVYEKRFTLTDLEIQQSLMLQFEGVYRNPKVTINGNEVKAPAYGYTPFFVNLNGLVHSGENVVRVVADNSAQPDSRWYTGTGIYRPVWLWKGGASYISPEGIRATTISCNPAQVRIETQVVGEGTVSIKILDGEDMVAQGEGNDCELFIPDGKLWSAETPNLYTCCVTLSQDGATVDTAQISFGIRQITWDTNGLYINGTNTLLRGGCVHHDNGILGARCYAESEFRRVRILKEAGYNAIRISHNPASFAILDACDQLGMYVMDETWDMWYNHKNKFDYATDFEANWQDDIHALVDHDYNHPSVILYSIANEISEPITEKGIAQEKEIVAMLHTLDDSRPVTGGINLMILSMANKGQGVYKEEGGMNESLDDKPKEGKQKKQKASGSLFFNMMTNMVGTNMNRMANGKKADAVTSPCLDELDIAGYNYASGRYPLEGKAHPDRIVFGSETFPQDIAKNWAMVKKYPYLIGDFMWTAWDYLGEAGIGAWTWDPSSGGFNKPYPWLLADVGAIDIIGTRLAPADYAAAVWGLLSAPAIHVQPVNHSEQSVYKSTWRGTNARPSWAWKDCEGKKAVVEVYDSSAAFIQLELNGQTIGKKRVANNKAIFKTKYQPGKLIAVSMDHSGTELSRSCLTSAVGSLTLSAMPEEIQASVGQIVYIPISIVGENGVIESNADEQLTVTVEDGELLAFGSTRPCTEESFLSGQYNSYYGQALAVVRCTKTGTLTFKVKGESLPVTTAEIIVS